MVANGDINLCVFYCGDTHIHNNTTEYRQQQVDNGNTTLPHRENVNNTHAWDKRLKQGAQCIGARLAGCAMEYEVSQQEVTK